MHGDGGVRSRHDSGNSYPSNDELDNVYIMDALSNLEKMIEEEKSKKAGLERRFDDLYSHRERSNREKSQEINRPPSPDRISRTYQHRETRPRTLENLTEDLVELVQKRNELEGNDNIFNVLKKNALESTEFKNDMIGKYGLGLTKQQTEALRKSSRKTIELNNEGLQEILLRFSMAADNNSKSKDLNRILNDSNEENEGKEVKKLTRHQIFLKRMQEYEERKKYHREAAVNFRETEEKSAQKKWFKPQINKKTEQILQKRNLSSIPIEFRVKEILKTKDQIMAEKRMQIEEEEKENMKMNCTFQPIVTPSKLYKQEKERLEMKGSSNKTNLRFRPNLEEDPFLSKLEDYEMKHRIEMKLLKDKQYQNERKSLREKPYVSPNSRNLAEKKRGYTRIDEKLYGEAFQKVERLKVLEKEVLEESCTFKPFIKNKKPRNEKPSKHQQKNLREAIQKFERVLRGQDGDDSLQNINNLDFFASPVKSILKTSPHRKSLGKSSEKSTKKKVYFQDRSVNMLSMRNSNSTKNPSLNTSFVDDDGFLNIVFDKKSIADLRRHLR